MTKQPLSQIEIENIEQYLERVHFKYEDLKCELIDHIASGIEKIKAVDPNITFSKALYEYSGTLPNSFFGDIIKEKTKALKMYWRKKIFRYMLNYFKLPRIILTLLISSLFFTGFILKGMVFFEFAIFVVLIAGLIYVFYNKNSFKLTHEHDAYLFVSQFRKVSLSIFSSSIFTNYYFIFLLSRKYTETDLFFGIVISLNLTLLIFIIHSMKKVFPKFLIDDANKKYAHLNLSFN